MADESRISTQIEMLGAKEYRDALKGINADLKLLDSGLKASQSAFKDLDGADALADRLEGLNKQYDKHRQKVQLIARQLEAAKAKYGENSQQVRTLQTALNTATTAMNKCGHEIDETQDKLNELQGGEKDAGKQAEKMAKDLEKSTRATKDQGREADRSTGLLGKLGNSMLSVAKGAAKMAAVGTVAFLAGTAAAATSAAKALIGCATSGAQFADDMLTLSVQTGISLETLQKLNYAAPLVDVDLQTMTSAMSKLTKEMGNMDKNGVKAGDAITKLGLTIYDSSGKLKSSEDMFWEIIYALGQIENPTERDALAMELFGKSAQELNPLIEASTKGIRELGEEAESMGVILSDEALATLGEYQNSLDRFNNVWAGFKNQLGANVSGLFQPFVDDATSAVAQVNNLLKDGWDETDADALAKILGGVWDNFVSDAKALWDKLSPVISSLISSVKAYLDEHLPTMLGNLGNLIKTAIGDLTTMATSLVEGIDWSKVGSLLNDLLIGAAGIFTSLVSKLPEIFKSIDWGDVFGALINLADTAVKAILECFGIDWKGITAGWNELVTECEQLWNDVKAIWNGVGEFFGGLAGSIASFFEKAWHDIKAVWNGVAGWFTNVFSGFTGWLDAGVGNVSQWAEGVWGDIKGAWSDVSGFVTEEWSDFTDLIDGKLSLEEWAGKRWANIKSAWTGVKGFVSDQWGKFTGWLEEKTGLVSWASKQWGSIKAAWSDVKGMISDGWGKFTGWLEEKTGLVSWATETWGQVKDAFSVTADFVSETWGKLTGWIDQKLGLSSWGETVKSTFRSIFTDAAKGIEDAFAAVGRFFTDIWYDIVGTCVGALNTLIDAWNTVGDLVDMNIGRIKWYDPRISTQQITEVVAAQRESLQNALRAGFGVGFTDGKSYAENFVQGYCEGTYAKNPELVAALEAMYNEVMGISDAAADDAADKGAQLANNLARGMKNRKNDVTGAVNDVMGAAKSKASSLASGFASIGAQVAAGLANGISAGASRAVAAVQALCSNIIAAGQGTLKIGSPSKVFEWMGEMSGEGYQIGLEKSMAGINALGGLDIRSSGYGPAGASGADGIDYNRLGEAVVQALKKEGVGTAVMVVDGKELGRSTERGVSAENYDRQVSGYKGRAAALRMT